ncbi:MAG: hypothetical protein NXI24_24665 [bacterium]|nr:hypothetical protein [bacterium]
MLALSFESRAEPRAPELALGRGPVAMRLLERVAARQNLSSLRGAAAPELFFVIGADLPWVDGVEYFGRVGTVYLPTTLAVVPEELFIQRVAREYGSCIVLPDTLIRIAAALNLSDAALPALREIVGSRADA